MTPEEQFLEHNGMSVEDAWEKVQTWAEEGKVSEAKSGCEQILKIFPEHAAKNLLTSLTFSHPEPQGEDSPEEGGDESEDETEQKSLGEKVKGVVNFVLTGKNSNSLGGKKKKTLEKPTSPSAHPQKTAPQIMGMGGLSTETPRKKDETLPDENSIEDDERMFGAISYIPFLCFFTLFSRKDSRFIQYHAWQGFAFLALFLLSLPVYFLLSVLSLFGFLFWLLYLFFFALVFFAMWTAWNGNYLEIPFISSFARTLSGRK